MIAEHFRHHIDQDRAVDCAAGEPEKVIGRGAAMSRRPERHGDGA